MMSSVAAFKQEIRFAQMSHLSQGEAYENEIMVPRCRRDPCVATHPVRRHSDAAECDDFSIR
jgi:hypothetical protein